MSIFASEFSSLLELVHDKYRQAHKRAETSKQIFGFLINICILLTLIKKAHFASMYGHLVKVGQTHIIAKHIMQISINVVRA